MNYKIEEVEIIDYKYLSVNITPENSIKIKYEPLMDLVNSRNNLVIVNELTMRYTRVVYSLDEAKYKIESIRERELILNLDNIISIETKTEDMLILK